METSTNGQVLRAKAGQRYVVIGVRSAAVEVWGERQRFFFDTDFTDFTVKIFLFFVCWKNFVRKILPTLKPFGRRGKRCAVLGAQGTEGAALGSLRLRSTSFEAKKDY